MVLSLKFKKTLDQLNNICAQENHLNRVCIKVSQKSVILGPFLTIKWLNIKNNCNLNDSITCKNIHSITISS